MGERNEKGISSAQDGLSKSKVAGGFSVVAALGVRMVRSWLYPCFSGSLFSDCALKSRRL